MTLSKQEQDALENLRRHVLMMREHVRRGAISYKGLRDNEVLLELIERLIRENEELKKLRLPA